MLSPDPAYIRRFGNLIKAENSEEEKVACLSHTEKKNNALFLAFENMSLHEQECAEVDCPCL